MGWSVQAVALTFCQLLDTWPLTQRGWAARSRGQSSVGPGKRAQVTKLMSGHKLLRLPADNQNVPHEMFSRQGAKW
jgi:hypothetical protein